MAVLPAQAIRALCVDVAGNQLTAPMISPFNERGCTNGLTWGLGPCTYDMRIRQDITLLPLWMLPIYVLISMLRWLQAWGDWPPVFEGYRCVFTLASAIEHVFIPHDICGEVMDKSSNARRGLSVFNTKFDPGFYGHPTLELHNCGLQVLRFPKGTPICQFKFERLEALTEIPYAGRYQGQGDEPTPYKQAASAWG